MSNGPIVNNTISTISRAPEAPAKTTEADASTSGAASGNGVAAPPAPESGAASGAEAKTNEPKEDKELELAHRWNKVATKEAAARKREVDLKRRETALEEREKAAKDRDAEYEAFLSDPVEWYIKRGKDPVEVAKRFAQPETEEQRRIRLIEERDAQREKEAKEREEKAAKQRKEQERHEAMRQFVHEITPDECPALTTLYAPKEIPRLVTELMQRPVDPQDPESESMLDCFRDRYSRNPTSAEVRELLEYEADLVLQRINRALQARNATPEASRQAQTEAGREQESGPTSLSNEHAAVTNAGKKKPLSLHERRRSALRELTQKLEAESASTKTSG